jgi:4-amino-4-deoxy-L-arabinose transferase-like glycosyltransferase
MKAKENLSQESGSSIPRVVWYILGLFLLSKMTVVATLPHWDELAYAGAAVQSFPERKTLFHFILKSIAGIFGPSIFFFHLFSLLCAAVTLFYTYKLAALLFTRETAVYAMVLLACAPLFYAQSALALPEIFVTLFMVLAIYALMSNNKGFFIASLTVAAAAKENGMLGAVMIALSLPLLAVVDRQQRKKYYGTFFVLTMLVFVFLVGLKSLWVTDAVWEFYIGHIRPFSGMNLGVLVRTVGMFFADSPLAQVTMVFLLLRFAVLPRRPLEGNTLCFLLLSAAFLAVSFLFYSVYEINVPRYWLPLYPFLAVTASAMFMEGVLPLQGGRLLAAGAVIFLLVSCVFALKEEGPFGSGARLERNMSYVGTVNVHAAAVRFVEQNYPRAAIAASWPFTATLRYPELGYVKKPLCVRELFDKPSLDAIYSWFRVSDDDLDIIVYSPQSDNSRDLKRYIDKYGWKPLKEFKQGYSTACVYGK